MKNLKYVLVLFLAGCFTMTVSAQDKKEKKLIKESDQAVAALIKENPSLRTFFDKSAGCVVFPNIGKGGFIIGGAGGNGVLYEYGKHKGRASIAEFSVGPQIGGQSLMEVIFFERKSDVDKFKESKYQFDAGISATALKSGVSLDAKYTDGVAVFTQTKGGLMAEVSIGGQKFKYKPF